MIGKQTLSYYHPEAALGACAPSYYDRKLAESNRGNKLTWKQKHYDAYAKPHALSLHDRIAASIQAS